MPGRVGQSLLDVAEMHDVSRDMVLDGMDDSRVYDVCIH